jgi:hypothetical protein
VAIFTSCFSGKSGISIIPENFDKVVSLFSARKLIDSNWINQKDEYMAPNIESDEYEIFRTDSIIYSLFNNSSNQSSLRQILYKGEVWDIKNQFFWISKEEMANLANQNNYAELYNDARTDSDRRVYKLLFGELKLLWKEYFPEQFKEFRAKYKVLEDKMRPMVYELGFLLK